MTGQPPKPRRDAAVDSYIRRALKLGERGPMPLTITIDQVRDLVRDMSTQFKKFQADSERLDWADKHLRRDQATIRVDGQDRPCIAWAIAAHDGEWGDDGPSLRGAIDTAAAQLAPERAN